MKPVLKPTLQAVFGGENQASFSAELSITDITQPLGLDLSPVASQIMELPVAGDYVLSVNTEIDSALSPVVSDVLVVANDTPVTTTMINEADGVRSYAFSLLTPSVVTINFLAATTAILMGSTIQLISGAIKLT